MSYFQNTSPYGGGHCPDRGSGFQSQARPASIGGCAPGTVPPMCDTARRITGAKAGAGLETIELGPYQSLQLLAIVDLAATPGVTVDDLLTDGESVFSKFKVDQGAAFVVDGLGDLANLTPALYDAGLNPIPPTPLNDALNQLAIVLNSAAGGEPFDFLVFFGNPSHAGHTMQKGSAGNY